MNLAVATHSFKKLLESCLGEKNMFIIAYCQRESAVIDIYQKLAL